MINNHILIILISNNNLLNLISRNFYDFSYYNFSYYIFLLYYRVGQLLDFGLYLEKVNSLLFVPFDGEWPDLDSWDAVWDEQKSHQNTTVKSTNVLTIHCENCLFRSEDK